MNHIITRLSRYQRGTVAVNALCQDHSYRDAVRLSNFPVLTNLKGEFLRVVRNDSKKAIKFFKRSFRRGSFSYLHQYGVHIWRRFYASRSSR